MTDCKPVDILGTSLQSQQWIREEVTIFLMRDNMDIVIGQ